MQWNPDQDVVVFIDMLKEITMMGKDMFNDEKKTKVHKKQASKGSRKKIKTSKEKDDLSVKKHSKRRLPPCISWQTDGQFFAVTYAVSVSQSVFKIYNRKGELQHSSECLEGPSSALAWQPAGQWIAMSQLIEEKFVIAMFDKGGFRRQEIKTPLTSLHEILSLHWSPDSEVLAVVWYTVYMRNEIRDVNIFLYVMDNSQWCLKQCLLWSSGGFFYPQWDKKKSAGKTLHLLTNTLCYERIRFDFRVDRSLGHREDDEAMIAVIDGTKLRLSSYRRSIIPPPMCNYTLTLPQGPQGEVPTCVNAVGFIRYPGKSVSLKEDVSANAFFVVDSYNVITFYDLKVTKQCKDSGPMRTVSSAVNTLLRLSPLRDPFCQTSDSLLNCLWINPDNFVLSCNNYLVALCSKEGPEDYQDYVSIEKNSKEPFVDNETIGSVEALGPDKVLIELTSGRIMEVGNFIVGKRCTPYNKFSTKLYGTIPEFCEQLFVSKQQATTHVYAFSESHRNLYHNGSLVASDVTSVFHAKTYLLFTTRTELKFVPLQDRPGFTIIGERPLEVGSRLFTVIPKPSRIVFQRLRGDLEAINPHNLSLSFIAKRLEALEYQEAFKIMRKERINLNLLVDDDPERFLAHLRSHFLPQITNVSWLNLFITDLANEDVCRTLYESNYPGWQLAPVNLASVSSGGYAVEGKIQFICDRLLDVMDSNPTILTQPKITCHVKQGQLEKALSLIWALKRDQPTPELAEQALRYLLSLIEPNVLYDVALGMYDLDLVRFVADISKKNSKEYLSFLNALKRQNEHYRKFRIDCHLKRYNRAVAHISHIKTTKERSREVMELIFNHGLYTVGIEHFRTSGNEENLRKICEQYAGHLRTTGKHAEASLMYERTGDIQQAISSACHALD
ncbi:elongator complex protein 1-like [Anopheles coustani]|uniref:elongator complex protein 1-like n=1 Tax=Anopheles coustani TaxID=139045 RepID=UPI002657E6D8|nr:elongator complex protein 1-like [Anopheles coustani]